ncbi:MAG TPA: MmcB family DNA repair protein, partial [Azospirillaceae bacterium]|nr:MmcB family DNA repair protein [Azospirillaceae bacterium]
RRALAARGMASLAEFPLADGRRADVAALNDRGDIVIIEIKSCAIDYQSDKKWRHYQDWCDNFYFATDSSFPHALIPQDCGLLVADAYGAVELRAAVPIRLAAARRRAMTVRFAQIAANRLHRLEDPLAAGEALSM